MYHFSQEHINIRKYYNTNIQANHWLTTMHTTSLTEKRIQFIESLPYFFFATSHTNGQPNINIKSTNNKQIFHVIDNKTLIFPDYFGNGILHGIGDIISNPQIAILLIDFKSNKRLKINGTATILDDKKSLQLYTKTYSDTNIARVIQVNINYIIENCSQYISRVKRHIQEC